MRGHGIGRRGIEHELKRHVRRVEQGPVAGGRGTREDRIAIWEQPPLAEPLPAKVDEESRVVGRPHGGGKQIDRDEQDGDRQERRHGERRPPHRRLRVHHAPHGEAHQQNVDEDDPAEHPVHQRHGVTGSLEEIQKPKDVEEQEPKRLHRDERDVPGISRPLEVEADREHDEEREPQGAPLVGHSTAEERLAAVAAKVVPKPQHQVFRREPLGNRLELRGVDLSKDLAVLPELGRARPPADGGDDYRGQDRRENGR